MIEERPRPKMVGNAYSTLNDDRNTLHNSCLQLSGVTGHTRGHRHLQRCGPCPLTPVAVSAVRAFCWRANEKLQVPAVRFLLTPGTWNLEPNIYLTANATG